MKNFNLTMKDYEKVFLADESKHILDSMNLNSINKAPNGCYGGGCGVCKIKISSGEFKKLSMSRKYISKEEEDAGFVLACRVFPKSNIEFEFIGKIKCKTNKEKKYGFV